MDSLGQCMMWIINSRYRNFTPGSLDNAKSMRQDNTVLLGPLAGRKEHVRVVTEREVPIHIFDLPNDDVNSSNDASLPPGVIYFHGGGMVLGSPRSGMGLILNPDDPVKVISVDYKLAPEHLCPAPVEDALAVTRWVLEHAEEIGVDKNRIGVTGASAGANLAAFVHQEIDGLKSVLLGAGMFDYSMGSRWQSWNENKSMCDLPEWLARWYWETYAPLDGPEREHEFCSPLRRLEESCALRDKRAPVALAAMTCDVFRDEDLAYARLLESNGVEVKTVVLTGSHCFAVMGDKVNRDILHKAFIDKLLA